jgi:hypothetical protein
MSQLFTYEIATLIELIDSKPCYWDKNGDISKDNIEKLKAWRELFFQCHHMSLMDFAFSIPVFVVEV